MPSPINPYHSLAFRIPDAQTQALSVLSVTGPDPSGYIHIQSFEEAISVPFSYLPFLSNSLKEILDVNKR